MKTELIEKLKFEKENLLRGGGFFFDSSIVKVINEAIQALEKQESEQVSVELLNERMSVLSQAYALHNCKSNLTDLTKVRIAYEAGWKEMQYQAMQTYASNKESDAVWVEPSREAIEFAEWISSKGFYRNRSQTDKYWFTEDVYYSGCFYTTEELYNQFLKEKEETK